MDCLGSYLKYGLTGSRTRPPRLPFQFQDCRSTGITAFFNEISICFHFSDIFLYLYRKFWLRAKFHNCSSTGSTLKVLITRQISFQIQQNGSMNVRIFWLRWLRCLFFCALDHRNKYLILFFSSWYLHAISRHDLEDRHQSDPIRLRFLPFDVR